MRPDEIRQEIKKLNLAEKLLLIKDVWDSIAEGNSELPMPEWQKRELDKRYKEYKAGDQNLHDWQSVHEEIRNERQDLREPEHRIQFRVPIGEMENGQRLNNIC